MKKISITTRLNITVHAIEENCLAGGVFSPCFFAPPRRRKLVLTQEVEPEYINGRFFGERGFCTKLHVFGRIFIVHGSCRFEVILSKQNLL
jgi:hypothetical protein